MNYDIILNEQELLKFINWLPDLQEGECYYVSLVARKKYHPSAKNDKSQCKRFTATDKDWLLRKIRQLEIPYLTYTNKDGTAVHNDALALYITVNPRSFALAQKNLMKKLVDTLKDPQAVNLNPSALALSAIQKAKSRTVHVDFDFDTIDITLLDDIYYKLINPSACAVLQTKGGFHLLVNPELVSNEFKKSWYQEIKSLDNVDVVGDNLIPVAGCIQGGFCPRLLEE